MDRRGASRCRLNGLDPTEEPVNEPITRLVVTNRERSHCPPRVRTTPESSIRSSTLASRPGPFLAAIEDRNGTLFGNPQDVVALLDAGFVLMDRGDNVVWAFLADGSPA